VLHAPAGQGVLRSGGDGRRWRRCVSDLGALGDQVAIFGEIASGSTARRVLLEIGERERDAIRVARAAARECAWALGAAPTQVVLDFDATLITAHFDKQQAAGNYKGGFGFHPLLVTCGRETLGAILRPGNAGANTASDHIDVLELALEALPASVLDGEILARADGAGASHDFADACRETKVRFSLGYTIRETVREAILTLNEPAWKPALNQDGEQRDGAWVAELTSNVDLSAWPAATRLICRRERPHPGAQLSFTDVDGHRFQCFITDQTAGDIAALEVLHRQHACVEDRIAEFKNTGLSKLPFSDFEANEAWLELAPWRGRETPAYRLRTHRASDASARESHTSSRSSRRPADAISRCWEASPRRGCRATRSWRRRRSRRGRPSAAPPRHRGASRWARRLAPPWRRTLPAAICRANARLRRSGTGGANVPAMAEPRRRRTKCGSST